MEATVECYWCGRESTGPADEVLEWAVRHRCKLSATWLAGGGRAKGPIMSVRRAPRRRPTP